MAWGLGAVDRARWQATLAPEFDAEVWAPFGAVLAQQLAAGQLTPAHAARARKLLDAGGVHVRPLTRDLVDAAATFIVQQGLSENPFSHAKGMTVEELTAERRRQLLDLTAVVDPLSMVLYVGDEMQGTFLCRDAGPPDAMRAAYAALDRTGLSPKQRAVLAATERVDEMLIAAARPERPDVDRWLELVGGATADVLRIYMGGPDVPPSVGRTLRDLLPRMMMRRIATCGVYTHIFAHAHERSVTPSVAVDAQAWRVRFGAPARSTRFDVHLVIPYADLGLPQTSDKAMHAVVAQVRPRSVNRWTSSPAHL